MNLTVTMDTERKAVGDVEAQLDMLRPMFDVMRVEVFGRSAVLAGPAVALEYGLAPAFKVWRKACAFVVERLAAFPMRGRRPDHAERSALSRAINAGEAVHLEFDAAYRAVFPRVSVAPTCLAAPARVGPVLVNGEGSAASFARLCHLVFFRRHGDSHYTADCTAIRRFTGKHATLDGDGRTFEEIMAERLASCA